MASTLLNERSYRADVIDAQLAHGEKTLFEPPITMRSKANIVPVPLPSLEGEPERELLNLVHKVSIY